MAQVALQPSTGGTFIVNLQTEAQNSVQGFPATIDQHLLWDRKAEGGFPGMFTIPFFSENGVSQVLSSVEVHFVIFFHFAA